MIAEGLVHKLQYKSRRNFDTINEFQTWNFNAQKYLSPLETPQGGSIFDLPCYRKIF